MIKYIRGTVKSCSDVLKSNANDSGGTGRTIKNKLFIESSKKKPGINILLPPVDKDPTVHGVIFTSKMNQLS